MIFTFCPRCAGKLKVYSDGSKRFICSVCAFTLYKNPAPTVSALFIKEENILLTKRAVDPQKGYWDLPGGFLEENEHPKEGLKREMKEELGVEIIIGDLFDIVMDWYEFQGERISTLNLYYFATMKNTDMRPDDDISEAKWFSLAHPPKNLSYKNNGIIISKLKRYLT